jgi:RNA polymerase sigma-70 factor (ECF subfamily)
MINNLELEKKTDEELVIIILENQSAFSCVVNRYKDKLLRYIRRISNVGLEEAEDMLQNIFIKVYLNLNEFDDGLKFSSWIYRIAHNEVIDNYRKRKVRPQLLDIDIQDSQAKELAGDTNIIEELSREELKHEVSDAINKLDLKFQEIIILKYIEEKDYQEISDIIKKPLGTVASRMNKAKAELKKVLANKNFS